ncbi:unnamed protein product [marine sediment metagenome]|uniref:Uncharacterized protein n=1 Tax=marine sediment metagenome TaxID=412755 RepID=X1VQ56_9ZZZZ
MIESVIAANCHSILDENYPHHCIAEWARSTFGEGFFEPDLVKAFFDIALQESMNEQIGVSSYGAGEVAVMSRSQGKVSDMHGSVFSPLQASEDIGVDGV